jgi:rhodanese-related sulfurtransferase
MAAAEFRRIDAEQALKFIFSACEQDRAYALFDARDLHSFEHGHIPTAQPLTEREIGSWIGKLPRAQPVLIYCYHGFSSQTFAKTFADFGFGEVYSIDGGFPALLQAFQLARELALQEKAVAEGSVPPHPTA